MGSASVLQDTVTQALDTRFSYFFGTNHVATKTWFEETLDELSADEKVPCCHEERGPMTKQRYRYTSYLLYLPPGMAEAVNAYNERLSGSDKRDNLKRYMHAFVSPISYV